MVGSPKIEITQVLGMISMAHGSTSVNLTSTIAQKKRLEAVEVECLVGTQIYQLLPSGTWHPQTYTPYKGIGTSTVGTYY